MNVYSLLFILLAYLFGSVPFSHLITKWRTGLVLREVGEGNVGSRNVWHVVGPRWAILTVLLDGLKGALTVLAGAIFQIGLPGRALAGVAAILGHQFPLFLRGKGGKGLATLAGVLISFSPLSSLFALGLFGLAYLALHNFNPSVAIGAAAAVVLPPFFGQPLWVAAYALGVFLLAGVKKLLDHEHEQTVWASHPWRDGAKPGFTPAEGSNEPRIADGSSH